MKALVTGGTGLLGTELPAERTAHEFKHTAELDGALAAVMAAPRRTAA